MKRFENRVAIITGASSGIGAATVARLVAEGAAVVGADVAEPDSARWAEMTADAAAAGFHRLDVRDEEAVASLIADTGERYGRLDVVVNAAGVAGGGAVHMLDAEEWNRVLDVNLKGTFLVCKHALGRMLEQQSGSIVNVASIEGLEGSEGGSSYNASKGGVVLLTKNMAIDYARKGIRVNCVCPGAVDTPLLRSVFVEALQPFLDRFVEAHLMGRMGKPEEIAAAVAFLASDDASFVTGHSLVVDGGFTTGRRFGFAELMGLG